jgi:rare lipoprotein A
MSVPLAVNERKAPTTIVRLCTIALVLASVSACGSRQVSGPSVASRGMYKVGTPYTINGTTYVPREQFDLAETGVASWYGPGFHGKSTANGERYDQRDHTAAHRTLQMPSIVRVTNLDNGRSTVVRVNDRGPYAHNRVIDLSRAAAQELDMIRNGTARVRIDQLPAESRLVKEVAVNGGGPPEQLEALAQWASGRRDAPTTVIAAAPLPTVRQPVPAPVPDPPAPPPGPLSPSDAPGGTTPAAASIATVMPAVGGYYVQTGAFSTMDNAERQRGLVRSYGSSEIFQASAAGRDIYRVRLGPYTTSDAAGIVADRLRRSGYGDARVVAD